MNTQIETEAHRSGNAQGVGIVDIGDGAVKIQRAFALAIMLLPTLGFLEMGRLGYVGQLDWRDGVLFVAMYILHMGGVTVGFHRMMAHRAFTPTGWFRVLAIMLGSIAGQGPVIYWVATHRAHHAYSDTPGDPHTPQRFGGSSFRERMRGLWYAHVPWMFARTVADPRHFARDLLRDRTIVRLSQSYPQLLIAGLILPSIAGYMIHGTLFGAWIGFIVGGLSRMFWANHAAWCVGSVCHMFGGRPFRTGDSSGNVWWVGVVAFGEGLQNNHHAFPSSYRHAVRWYEPDFSGWCIYLFSKLGFVRNLKHPSPDAVARMRL